MILVRRVEGGVLLYALLMLGIFALIFNFYLGRGLAQGRNLVAIKEATQAQMMAELAKSKAASLPRSGDNVNKPVDKSHKKEPATKPFVPKTSQDIPKNQNSVDKSGKTVEKSLEIYKFDQGQAQVNQQGVSLVVEVEMAKTGRRYQFRYRLSD